MISSLENFFKALHNINNNNNEISESMLNMISQVTKGSGNNNIRVFVRFRPLNDKEKENNPSFVNYADSRYDPDGKIGSLHLHFKYGYFPLYMNIDAPYMR